MKIKFITFGLFILTLLGCCEVCEKEETKNTLKTVQKEQDNLKNRKDTVAIEFLEWTEKPSTNGDNKYQYEGICSDQALDSTVCSYSPNQKKAILFIPVPEGFSKPAIIHTDRDSVTLITTGDKLVTSYKTYKVKVKNSLFRCEDLKVLLKIHYKENEANCKDIFGEKHKSSVVAGINPIDPNKKNKH